MRLDGLEEIVGLRLRDQTTENMIELDFGDYGTVMLNVQDTRHGAPSRTTEWVFDRSATCLRIFVLE